jgi:hypothetical protein
MSKLGYSALIFILLLVQVVLNPVTVTTNKNNYSWFSVKSLVIVFLLLFSVQASAVNWSISSYSPSPASYKYTGQLTLKGNFSKAQGGRTIRIRLSKGPGPGAQLPISSWSKSAITVKVTGKLIHENYWFSIYESNGKHVVSSSIPLTVTRPRTLAEPGGNNQKTIKPDLATSRLGTEVGGLKTAPQIVVKPQTFRRGVTSCATGFSASPPDSQGRYKCLTKKLSCQSGYQPQLAAHYDAMGKRLYYVCGPK